MMSPCGIYCVTWAWRGGGATATAAEEEEGIRKGTDTYCIDDNYYFHQITGI